MKVHRILFVLLTIFVWTLYYVYDIIAVIGFEKRN